MRSILIILGLAVALAVAGFFIVEETMRSRQNEAAARSARPETGNPYKDMAEANRQVSIAAGDLAERQRGGMIGAAVGGGAGLLLGIGLSVWLDRRKPAAPRPHYR